MSSVLHIVIMKLSPLLFTSTRDCISLELVKGTEHSSVVERPTLVP